MTMTHSTATTSKFVLFFVCVVFLAAWWAWSLFEEDRNQGPNVAGVSEPVGSKSIPPAADSKGAEPLPAGEEKELRRPVSNLESNWHSGFAKSEPYPLIVSLRDARVKGSYAASRLLAKPCTALNFMVRDPIGEGRQVPNNQERLQAKSRLSSYCSQIPATIQMSLDAPLADDLEGIKYRAAQKILDAFMVKPKDEVRTALEELARQGGLADARDILQLNAKFQGRSWRGSREVFSAAFEIAELRASSSGPEMVGSDIRLQLRCWKTGRCVNAYEAFPDDFSDEMKQETLSLAAAMENALRNGDVSAFLGKP